MYTAASPSWMAGEQVSLSRRRVCTITDTGPGTRKWIINERGVATIILSPDGSDYVWGSVLLLNTHDEQNLDKAESDHYIKSILRVDPKIPNRDSKTIRKPGVLVYIDKNTTPGRPRPEYVVRLKKAMKDGLAKCIPQAYFDKYWKPFLDNPAPSVGSEAAEAELEE